jgi:cell division protein ZapD
VLAFYLVCSVQFTQIAHLFASRDRVAQNSGMVKPAGKIAAQPAPGIAHYEQPLSERMRTFLRLEFLYHPMLHNSDRDDDWATRATISTLLEILVILSRGDVRSEALNELDHQIDTLKRFQSHTGVDGGRLDKLIRNLGRSRGEISRIGTGFLQPLKDSEFLNAIKHRSAIPGGTCEFDLPVYSHWLRQPIGRRQEDMATWIECVRPLCDVVSELLWLIRESAQPQEKKAVKGMYQHNMQKDGNCRILRVSLAEGSPLFPEISGSQHRFTVRFLEWSTVESRAVQTGQDVPFKLSVC